MGSIAVEFVSEAGRNEIDVLVVGAGIGGLCCAIELHRQGHKVQVLEGKGNLDGIGDFVGIGISAIRQFEKWPGMMKKYHEIRYKPIMSFLNYNGELLGGPFPEADTSATPIPVPRPKLQRFFYDFAMSLGIPVLFGKEVADFVENTSKRKAGVVTAIGERFEASLVVAADGVGSKSWQIVNGTRAEATSSGFAVYRTAFSTQRAHEDDTVAKHFPILEDNKDDVRMYLGPNTHAITVISKDVTTWMLTHKDTNTSTNSWSTRISADEALKEISKSGVTWDPALLALIKRTPEDSIVDWRLLWRNPNPKWVSDSGRILQIGDAAHSFLPTSANGGTQACEDAISLAACLRMAGNAENIPVATRVHFALRFDRVSCCQRNGFRNREMWHNTDTEHAKVNPEKLAEMTGRWIMDHDPEQYVYDHWSECANALVTGQLFKNTNIPPGYIMKPWTIEQILDPTGKDNCLTDEGDWT